MSFSYLKLVKSLVNQKVVFERGLKVYLDGLVGLPKALPLDFWFEYAITGHRSIIVRMPLLHLAMPKNKLNDVQFSHQAFIEFCTCTCAYYHEVGVCEHLVSVCAYLENQYNFEQRNTNKKQVISQVDNLLDSIFTVESQKLVRLALDKLEEYMISTKVADLVWLENLVLKSVQDQKLYHPQLVQFIDQLAKYQSIYEKEPKLVLVFLTCIKFGSLFWWQLLKPMFDNFSFKNTTSLWVGLWKLKMVKITSSFETEFETKLRSLESKQKQAILERLQQEFNQGGYNQENNRQIWLDFVFASRYQEMIEESIEKLDPLSLIKVCKIIPEKREQIELAILKQMKIWADFLIPGNYQEVIQVFTAWRKDLGDSDYLQEVIKYYLMQHRKKHTLLKQIKNATA